MLPSKPPLTPSQPIRSRQPETAFAGYSKYLVALHWLMFVLLITVYASIELRVLFAKGTEMRDFMKSLHFMLGLSVLLMVSLRFMARKLSAHPVTQTLQGWESVASTMATLGHWALYALMLGMPLLGWLYLSAAGKPVPFFGLELPGLIDPNKDWAHDIKELHETLGVAGYWLIGVHVTAALGHHYLLKDKLLHRMSLRRLVSA